MERSDVLSYSSIPEVVLASRRTTTPPPTMTHHCRRAVLIWRTLLGRANGRTGRGSASTTCLTWSLTPHLDRFLRVLLPVRHADIEALFYQFAANLQSLPCGRKFSR